MKSDTEEIVAKARDAFLNLMIGDIRRAFYGKSKVGAMLLSLCAIDTLGCYYADKPKGKPIKEDNAKHFRRFVADYMDESYKPIADKLFGALRCFLVHGYTTKDFDLIDGEPHLHLQKRLSSGGERQMINVDTFIDDVEKATKKYLDALEKDSSVLSNFKIQFADAGLMTVYQVRVPVPVADSSNGT